ncbi:exosortase/archaeosortase family protein [Haloferula sp.]|uniref:exosortase/archaeosortase family protein n=1 Tax=Haloferula sp. TaxID=2497595 RepID=UPI003C728623
MKRVLKSSDVRAARRRLLGFVAGLFVLCCLFVGGLTDWFQLALRSNLHSHTLIIPVVTIFLIVTERKSNNGGFCSTLWLGLPMLGLCLGGWLFGLSNQAFNTGVHHVSLQLGFFLAGVWALTLTFFGLGWVRSAFFPLAFLSFMLPMPEVVEQGLEQWLITASAQVSEMILRLGGIPVFREGQLLELPGVTLEVAEECSGIRSSWVLLITSVLAGYLFLRTLPSRLILVAVVLPLGVLRNAVRIAVIGWLCVEEGPELIDGWIHRKGGPFFFAASLIPLLLIALMLGKLETRWLSKSNQSR